MNDQLSLQHPLILSGRIVVVQRAHDWMAYETESAASWESGRTKEEALENLLKAHPYLQEGS